MICPGTRRYVTALRVLLIATALLAAPARAIYSEPAAAAPVGDGDFDQGFAAVKSEDWAVDVAALERAAANHRDGADHGAVDADVLQVLANVQLDQPRHLFGVVGAGVAGAREHRLDGLGVCAAPDGEEMLLGPDAARHEAHAAVLQLPLEGEPDWLRIDSAMVRQARASGMLLNFNALFEGVAGIEAVCGGNCYCGTCRIFVALEWQQKLQPAAEEELAMIEASGEEHPDARLACQIPVTETLDGIRVTTPEFQK